MRREIPNWLQSLYMFMVEKQKRIGMFSLGAGIEKFLALRKEKDVKKVFSFAQAVRFFCFLPRAPNPPAGYAHSRRELLVDFAHQGAEASAFFKFVFVFFVFVLNSYRPRRAFSLFADAAISSASRESIRPRRRTEKFSRIRWRTRSAPSLRSSRGEARRV